MAKAGSGAGLPDYLPSALTCLVMGRLRRTGSHTCVEDDEAVFSMEDNGVTKSMDFLGLVMEIDSAREHGPAQRQSLFD
jgi:hypothetical protein